MSEMIEVKTAELTGDALHWAVAVAQGWRMRRVPNDVDGKNGGEVLAPQDLSRDFQFPPRGSVPVGYFLRRWSTDWSQGGPLISEYADMVINAGDHYECRVGTTVGAGPTILTAACRAVVTIELGEYAVVPAELLTATPRDGGEG